MSNLRYQDEVYYPIIIRTMGKLFEKISLPEFKILMDRIKGNIIKSEADGLVDEGFEYIVKVLENGYVGLNHQSHPEILRYELENFFFYVDDIEELEKLDLDKPEDRDILVTKFTEWILDHAITMDKYKRKEK